MHTQSCIGIRWQIGFFFPSGVHREDTIYQSSLDHLIYLSDEMCLITKRELTEGC